MREEATVQELLREGQAALTALDSARLDADLLLGHTLGCSRVDLICRREAAVPAALAARYRTLLAGRAEGRPMAYLLGRQEFWSLDLAVSEAVLVPRPETELLVSLALARCPVDQTCAVLDLGTGSGAIALAVASERPRATVVALDRSAAAVAQAEANRARLGLDNVRCMTGNWLTGISQTFDLIMSNPPYIAEGDPALAGEGLCFEPRSALVAGADGLADLRIIANAANARLQPGGWLLLEHGARQGAAVRELLEKAGFTCISTTRDLADHERVTLGQREASCNG